MSCATDPPLGAAALAIDVVLIVGTAIVPIPQVVKLVRARSSRGLTPLTLCLTLVFNVCSFGGALISKWRQVARFDYLHLLDLLQLLLLGLSMGVVLLLVVAFPPSNTRLWRAVVAALVAATVGVLTTCSVLSASDPCGPVPLGLSRGLGVTGAVAAVVQFLPQLRLTYVSGGAEALSGAMYAIQVAGGYAICANLIFLEHEAWQTWTPMLVSTSTQAAVLALCCAYSLRRRRERRQADTAPACEARDAPLLAGASEAAQVNELRSDARFATRGS